MNFYQKSFSALFGVPIYFFNSSALIFKLMGCYMPLLLTENFFYFNHGAFKVIFLLKIKITRESSDQSFSKRKVIF